MARMAARKEAHTADGMAVDDMVAADDAALDSADDPVAALGDTPVDVATDLVCRDDLGDPVCRDDLASQGVLDDQGDLGEALAYSDLDAALDVAADDLGDPGLASVDLASQGDLVDLGDQVGLDEWVRQDDLGDPELVDLDSVAALGAVADGLDDPVATELALGAKAQKAKMVPKVLMAMKAQDAKVLLAMMVPDVTAQDEMVPESACLDLVAALVVAQVGLDDLGATVLALVATALKAMKAQGVMVQDEARAVMAVPVAVRDAMALVVKVLAYSDSDVALRAEEDRRHPGNLVQVGIVKRCLPRRRVLHTREQELLRCTQKPQGSKCFQFFSLGLPKVVCGYGFKFEQRYQQALFQIFLEKVAPFGTGNFLKHRVGADFQACFSIIG